MKKKSAHKAKKASEMKSESAIETKGDKTSALKYVVIILGIIVVIGGIVVAMQYMKGKGGDDGKTPVKGAVTIVEYSDFQCPFCQKAYPTVKKLQELYGNKINVIYKQFPLDFHANAEIAAEASECARDQGKFWEYHDILFEKGQGDGTGLAKADLKQYAKDLGLDTARFDACLESGEKKTIVATDAAEGKAKGVTGTPGFFVGEQFLAGAYPLENFIQAIDKELGTDSGFLAALNANEPAVEMTVVNDKACGPACDTARLEQVLKQFFPKMTVKQVDISTDEGKEIVAKFSLEKVPAYVLSGNIAEASKFKDNAQLQTAFLKVDDDYKIRDEATGSTRYIDPAKQAEVEAALAKAKAEAKEKLNIGDKPQIDFFVMSYCPYGNQAEEAIAKAYLALKDKAVFVPHFVFYSNYQGGGPNYCIDAASKFCSMHGVQEANQDIREMCVFKESGIGKTFDFMIAMNAKCSAQNADSCWTAVAKELKLDADAIAQCEKDHAEEYAKEEQDLGNLLSVQGSPTVFINGESYEGARTGTGFLAGLCAGFDDKPAECNTVINESTAIPQGGCGG